MRIAMLAGEQSGDLLGSDLMAALKKKEPSLTFFGVGGEKMKAAGLSSLLSMEKLQTMGIVEALIALPRLAKHFFFLRNKILEEKPDAVVLIDFPDFNMKLAASLRKKGYRGKLIHYVCPSIWAWRKGRIKTLEKNYDLLLSILPFEKSYFEDSPLPCHYVGHPLPKKIPPPTRLKEPHLIALFPGSRPSVIAHNLPYQLKAAELLYQENPHLTFAVSVARESLAPLITDLTKEAKIPLTYSAKEKSNELMARAQAAIATSGTNNLELALNETPTVVIYFVSFINGLIGKLLFRLSLPYYSLPNIIYGDEVFPEMMGTKIFPKKIASELNRVMSQESEIKERCRKVRTFLGDQAASDQAAKSIFSIL